MRLCLLCLALLAGCASPTAPAPPTGGVRCWLLRDADGRLHDVCTTDGPP